VLLQFDESRSFDGSRGTLGLLLRALAASLPFEVKRVPPVRTMRLSK
jgi:hypothetical protein